MKKCPRCGTVAQDGTWCTCGAPLEVQRVTPPASPTPRRTKIGIIVLGLAIAGLYVSALLIGPRRQESQGQARIEYAPKDKAEGVRPTDSEADAIQRDKAGAVVGAELSELGAAAERLVKDGLREGAIGRIDESTRRVYVHPVAWAQMNVDQKEQFARAMAVHFKTSQKMEVAHVYDYQSGKELASWDRLWGFSIK